ncbi:unnamed protein product [Coregonus sp. 'balchen']|nr:unnamed protein product [Coregonus sp. 'balchen']
MFTMPLCRIAGETNTGLYNRDFQLGKVIVDNITDSLYGSSYTLCLVSRHYPRGNWCSLELRLATLRLLVGTSSSWSSWRTSPARHLSAQHRLARLVKTRI